MIWALCLWLATAWAGPAEDAGAIDARVAEARHFLHRGWIRDAGAELRSAEALPGAAEHFELHWIGAQIAWELHDVGWAEELLSGAVVLAPDAETRVAATTQLHDLRANFGYLVVHGPRPGLSTRLQLERTDLEFDPEKKRLINDLSVQLRAPQVLPMRVGLPRGNYTLNGVPAQVSAARETEITLPYAALGARGLAALQLARPEIDAGVGILLGTTKAGRQPDFRVRLAWNQPLGPVLAGLVVEARNQTWLGPGAQGTTGPRPTGVGVRIGTELLRASSIAIQPGIQLMASRVAGLPTGEPGMAIEPGGDLLLEYREGGRNTSLGTGVRIAAHGVFLRGAAVPWSGAAIAIFGHSSLVF